MSDSSQGPGWWQNADGKWYPPRSEANPPGEPTPGGPVYDVVSRAGVLVDRIQLPSGYTLVGFGAGKVVFLSMRDAKGLHLARVRLR